MRNIRREARITDKLTKLQATTRDSELKALDARLQSRLATLDAEAEAAWCEGRNTTYFNRDIVNARHVLLAKFRRDATAIHAKYDGRTS